MPSQIWGPEYPRKTIFFGRLGYLMDVSDFMSSETSTNTIIFTHKHPDSSSNLEYTYVFTYSGLDMSSWGPNYDGFMAMYGFM